MQHGMQDDLSPSIEQRLGMTSASIQDLHIVQQLCVLRNSTRCLGLALNCFGLGPLFGHVKSHRSRLLMQSQQTYLAASLTDPRSPAREP